MVALGHGLGDDGRSMVSLSPEVLQAAAISTTGLDDFGDDWWEEPFRRLCASLETEARLHLPGRIRTRRAPAHSAEPAAHGRPVEDGTGGRSSEPVHAPIVVTGLGRSGTTLLHELLACDPDNRPPLLWELLTPSPTTMRPATCATTRSSSWTRWSRPSPPCTRTGAGCPPSASLPSPTSSRVTCTPASTTWPSTPCGEAARTRRRIYDWHKRHLQTLQWVSERPTTRWVVKAPSHLSALPLVFSTYPDARVVITHRDPLRVIGSLTDLMATLHYMHSEHVDHAVLVEFMAMGFEMQMDHVTAERDAGASRPSRSPTSCYRDLVADPLATVERLYAGLGAAGLGEFRAALEAYLAARHSGRAGGHEYSFADTGPRPGHPPGPAGALPGALRGPIGGLNGLPSGRGAFPAAQSRRIHGLEARDGGGPGVGRRPG